MFLRIDTDLFINVNNVMSYKLYDEADAYKLTVWSVEGKIIHTVFYLKHIAEQMSLLGEVVSNLRELTINPDISMFREVQNFPDIPEENTEPLPTREEVRRIKEQLNVVDEDRPETDTPRQLSIFDKEITGEED